MTKNYEKYKYLDRAHSDMLVARLHERYGTYFRASHASGLHPSVISMSITGVHRPTTVNAQKIADILGLTVEQCFPITVKAT